MKKILSDLLKSPSGKYSRKSVITIVFSIFTIGVGIYAAMATNPKEVFDSCLIFLGALVGMNITDKKIKNNQAPPQDI